MSPISLFSTNNKDTLDFDMLALHSCGQDAKGRFTRGNTCWQLKASIRSKLQAVSAAVKAGKSEEEAIRAKPAIKPTTKPKPKSAKPVEPAKPEPAETKPEKPPFVKHPPALTPESFAGHALAAAGRVPESKRLGNNKVFIHHAHEEFANTPEGRNFTLPQFKNWLAIANNRRHLDLSRADMVEGMNPADVKASHTPYMGAGFNFITLPEGQGNGQVGAEAKAGSGQAKGEAQSAEEQPGRVQEATQAKPAQSKPEPQPKPTAPIGTGSAGEGQAGGGGFKPATPAVPAVKPSLAEQAKAARSAQRTAASINTYKLDRLKRSLSAHKAQVTNAEKGDIVANQPEMSLAETKRQNAEDRFNREREKIRDFQAQKREAATTPEMERAIHRDERRKELVESRQKGQALGTSTPEARTKRVADLAQRASNFSDKDIQDEIKELKHRAGMPTLPVGATRAGYRKQIDALENVLRSRQPEPPAPVATKPQPTPQPPAKPLATPAKPATPTAKPTAPARQARIEDRIERISKQVSENATDARAVRQNRRNAGRAMLVRAIARAKESGQAGLFGKLKERREASAALTGQVAKPATPTATPQATPATPAVPQATPQAASAPSAPSGLVSAHDRIRQAFDTANKSKGGSNFVKIHDIHKQLPDIPLPALHHHINELRRSGEFSADPHEGLYGSLSPEERGAALTESFGGGEKTSLPYLSRREGFQPQPPQAVPSQPAESPRRALDRLHAERNRITSERGNAIAKGRQSRLSNADMMKIAKSHDDRLAAVERNILNLHGQHPELRSPLPGAETGPGGGRYDPRTGGFYTGD